MFSEQPELNLYTELLQQIKKLLVQDTIVYGQTKRGLKFLKQMMHDEMKDVVFIVLPAD